MIHLRSYLESSELIVTNEALNSSKVSSNHAINELEITQSYDCNSNTTTLSAIGAINVSWSPSEELSGSTGNVVTASVTRPVMITATGTSIVSGDLISGNIMVYPGPQSSTYHNFGQNEWMVECYRKNDFTQYRGYYIDSNLNFDSRDLWNQNKNPSEAPGYIGCSVPNNNHSYKYKRQGFECGEYQINIDRHDDYAVLLVDGKEVWRHNGCCDTHDNVWVGYLGPQSLVEFTVREFNGRSYGAVSFDKLSNNFEVHLSSQYDCNLGRTTLFGLNVANPTWSPPQGLSATNENIIEAGPSTPTWYTLSGIDICSGQPFKDSILVHGDPVAFGDTTFGDNFWYGYAYNGNNFQSLRGHYIENNLSFDSRNSWPSNTSPSRAGNYVGCNVNYDTHSYIYKRTNFNCGQYSIDIPAHDDYARLYIDGVMVWHHNGCCDAHVNVWTGPLGENSTIEYRIREFYGQSYGGIKITRLNNTSWTGFTDNDWNNASNWSNGMPGENTEVTIPEGLSNYPTISTSASCMNLIIEDFASLVLEDGSVLSISGNLDVGIGTFITNKSTVEFTDDCSSGIIRSEVELDFYNLTLNAGSDMRNETPAMLIRGALNVKGHTFFTEDKLTLESTDEESARILELAGNADVIGDVRFKRKISAGPNDWRLIGLPIENATIADFKDDFITTGFPGSHYPNWPANNPFVSVVSYDESLISGLFAHKDSGFVAPTGENMPLGNGVGYRAYLSGNRTIDATGSIIKGDVDFNVTHSPSLLGISMDGWELLSNPYPCPIDWNNASSWTLIGISNVVYYWNAWRSQYEYFVRGGVSTGDATQYIASGQGFWVQTIGVNPSLILHESAKVDLNSPFIKNTSESPLSFMKIGFGNDEHLTEFVIGFSPESSNDYDFSYDAHYLSSWNQDIPVAFTESQDHQQLAINFLNDQNNELSIPIHVEVNSDGNYNFNLTENTLNDHSCISMEDTYTGDIYDIVNDTVSIALVATDDNTSRFVIHYTGGASTEIITEPCLNSDNGMIVAQTEVDGMVTYEWFQDSTLIHTNMSETGTDTLFNAGAGDYMIRTTGAQISCGFTESEFVVEGIMMPVANFTASDTTLNISIDSTLIFVNHSDHSFYNTWEFSDGAVYENTDTVIHTFEEVGMHTVILTAGNMGCTDQIIKTINVQDQILTVEELVEPMVRINQLDQVLNINLINFDQPITELVLYDALGREIKRKTGNMSHHFSLDVSGVSSGTFILSFVSRGNAVLNSPVYIQ